VAMRYTVFGRAQKSSMVTRQGPRIWLKHHAGPLGLARIANPYAPSAFEQYPWLVMRIATFRTSSHYWRGVCFSFFSRVMVETSKDFAKNDWAGLSRIWAGEGQQDQSSRDVGPSPQVGRKVHPRTAKSCT
jgi:hypothetical protein